ncbi:MAG: MmgE/PrpD family protein [Dehalococcoidia bacterium]|nr:MmgE/PrpD family protein [Dehalococcoidia bacterium]
MDRISRYLAEYAFSLDVGELPGDVVHESKRRVMDSLGIAMGGYDEEPCRIARSLALETGAPRGATVFGTRHKAAPDMAAFANGTMVHSQDYMDTYLSAEACHPSDNLSAVLAAAEHSGAGGRDVIAGAVLAYEVMCRFCDAAGVRERGWDHVVYGAVSSALAAGKVLGLGVSELAEAASLAATSNVALRQTRVGEVSMWKACAPANAARNGLMAALLAARGLKGPAEAFTGEKGFLNQVTGPLELPEFAGEGRPFMIGSTHIKLWPVQYNTQAGIQAALQLREDVKDGLGFRSMTIEIADVGADLSADTRDKWDPRTRETADHSLPYIVVSAFVDGEVDRSTFDMERIRDPERLALLKRVTVRRDPEFSRAYPRALSVRVGVETEAGELLTRQVDYPLGHCKSPMSDVQVEEKFRRLTAGRVPEAQVDEILRRLWSLEEEQDIGGLVGLLAPCAG